MAATGTPYSYSFEGQKTDVPLSVDSATGPESAGQKSQKGGKGVYRRGRKGKKH
jgi:hypothetical protein